MQCARTSLIVISVSLILPFISHCAYPIMLTFSYDYTFSLSLSLSLSLILSLSISFSHISASCATARYVHRQHRSAVRTDANFHPSNCWLFRKLNLRRIVAVSQHASYRAVIPYTATTSFWGYSEIGRCALCAARNGVVKVRGE